MMLIPLVAHSRHEAANIIALDRAAYDACWKTVLSRDATTGEVSLCTNVCVCTN